MLNSDRGRIEIQGSAILVMVELTTMIHAVKKAGIFAKYDLHTNEDIMQNLLEAMNTVDVSQSKLTHGLTGARSADPDREKRR